MTTDRKNAMHLLTLLAVLFLAISAQAEQNNLAHHPSPYLALHGDDPVHWQAWGPGVLERARAENKLIFVSSGYFSCHWCHVMQKESYQDEAVAQLLNGHFIAVKVDRELHPALDQTLIDFVEATRGHAGWPLNVFLTPDGHPLFGSTYMQQAPFLDLLGQLRDRWQSEGAELSLLARQALDQWRPPVTVTQLEPGAGASLEQAFVEQAMQASDSIAGGFGNQNKFPSSPQIDALLDIHERHPSQQIEAFVGYTLFMMASQGLRDQIGGGFFRYTVDPTWQTPHFEKMLYNNAQLPRIYLRAARLLKQPTLTAVALDTLEFVERELRHPDGGYISSLSAVDARNVEGGYYLWHPEDIRELLDDPEYAIAEKAWNLDQPGGFDEGHLPVQSTEVKEIAKTLKQAMDEVIRLSQSAREKLFKARQSRTLPRDEKRITAWNALMLQAFVEAARHGGDKTGKYARLAKDLRDFMVHRMIDDAGLRRSLDGEQSLGKAGLEDYAYTARALWDYAEFTNDEADRRRAIELSRQAWKLFATPAGWRLGTESLLPFDASEPLVTDGPMPSPSAVLIRLTLEMGDRADARDLRQNAVQALYRGHQRLQDEPYFHATHVTALAAHENKK